MALRKVAIISGLLVAIVMIVCAFNKDYFIYLYNSRVTESSYNEITPSAYHVNYHFNFINENDSLKLTNKNDILPEIYYLINNGIRDIDLVCKFDYKTCFQDVYDVAGKEETLSLLNNFVHPYNNFDGMEIKGHNMALSIKLKYLYTDKEINEINTIVDNIIKEKLTNEMTTKEKIKVIHDYIIDNTDYDKLKTQNIDDDTYKSNTAYGVLVQGFGICSGYSDAMAIFLNKLGVVNYRVSNDKHIWNLVYLDGKWLHLDLTWDDPVSEKNINRSTYFLIDNDTLKSLDDGTHYFDSAIFSEVKTH